MLLQKRKLKNESIKAIFQGNFFAAARNIELPERISYLGPEGEFCPPSSSGATLGHRLNIFQLIQ